MIIININILLRFHPFKNIKNMSWQIANKIKINFLFSFKSISLLNTQLRVKPLAK